MGPVAVLVGRKLNPAQTDFSEVRVNSLNGHEPGAGSYCSPRMKVGQGAGEPAMF